MTCRSFHSLIVSLVRIYQVALPSDRVPQPSATHFIQAAQDVRTLCPFSRQCFHTLIVCRLFVPLGGLADRQSPVHPSAGPDRPCREGGRGDSYAGPLRKVFPEASGGPATGAIRPGAYRGRHSTRGGEIFAPLSSVLFNILSRLDFRFHFEAGWRIATRAVRI